jgi:predicted nucleic acid-binding protein
MDRLFLDANVLFSAAYSHDAGMLKIWKLKDVVLCTSRHAIQEARVNLEEAEQSRRLTQLVDGLQLFEMTLDALPAGITLPDKDVPILLAAINARATHLLTGDLRHFGAYMNKKVAGIVIQLPGEYLRARK